MHDLPLLKMASAMARHAALRHEVASRNVAQADTPGYRAREVAAFDPMAAMEGGEAEARVARAALVSPSGNSVSLPDEMAEATMAQMQHETALGIYRKSMELLRLGLGRGGR